MSQVSQIELITGICRLLQQHSHESLLPRQFNAGIAAARNIVMELEKPEQPVIPGMGVSAWLQSDHVGPSSRFMVLALCYPPANPDKYAFPQDNADFARCLGLLEAAPELRERLHEMAQTGPEWAALIPFWDDLTAAYVAGHTALVSTQIRALVSPWNS